MPSLSLSNSLTKARDTKRTQLIVNDPATAISEAIWDDVYERSIVTYLSSGTSYISVQATASNGYCAREFPVTPYSEYTITAVLIPFGSGASADLLVGTAAEGTHFVDENLASSGTISETFSVGNRKTIWVTLNTVVVSTVIFWDSIKIEETG